ncbi:MAG: alanine racemase, partial [Lachnospiraceae bacterium]|nr:alanine racemase [Lachnospiraceae bacterium]
AYGHGYGIIPALVKGGMNAFCVSNLDEAIEVRKYDTEHPVIMLEPIDKKFYGVASQNNISVCVNDEETFKDIVDSKEPLKLQFKVNSGMNRLGFSDKDTLKRVIDEAYGNLNLEVEGIFTHFHTNGLTDREYELNQKKFEEITSLIDLTKIKMVHLDRTQTVFLHDAPAYENGARIGISLYGFSTIYPFSNSIKGKIRKLQREFNNKRNHVLACKELKKYDLKTAFSLYSEVLQVNKVKAGEYVGYGLLHKAETDEYIAVIDIGYADGIGRKRSGSLVSVNGKKYKIVGEVGMGMIEVLVDETVKKHDRVTVLGGEIPISSITRHNGTTMYELMTNVDSTIERRYK